jgi:hypothetical protein
VERLKERSKLEDLQMELQRLKELSKPEGQPENPAKQP